MAKLQKFMGHTDPRTTQRYYDHLEVEDLEVALDLVPELPAISGSKLALRPEERGPVERRSGVSGE